ncbi:hypothetical protein RFI_35418, partial [Reticulomyxa filosa]
MNGKLLVTRSSMELSLVFVAIHVLNALMLVSSANNEYTRFSGELDEQTNTLGPSRQYKHIENVMEYFNQLCVELITWRIAQYPQVNSLTAVSSVQMFNKESMQFNSKSIRISQNTLPIDPKNSKSSHNKTPVVSIDIKIKWKKKMFIKKKNMFIKKKFTFANWEVEVMTPQSNEMCKQCQPGTIVIFETSLFAANCSWHYTGAHSKIDYHS